MYQLIITYLNAPRAIPAPNCGGRNPELPLARKKIDAFVTRHYDRDARMLDLSNLSAFLPDVTLINFNSKQFAVLLESILAVSCPDILTLVLNQNKISSFAGIAYLLKQSRLKLINLSLDSNEISNFDELVALKEFDLRELVLLNNPICDGLDDLSYKLEVVKRLPNLVMLDLQKIKQGEDTHPITQLPPINGSFFDNPALKVNAEGFLKKYYDTYDSTRESLVAAYSEQACFSLTRVPTSQPHRRDGTSFRRSKFGAYDPFDRNLTDHPSSEDRTKTLKTGPTHIVGTLIDLPQSKHDYSSFTIDCFVSSIGTYEMMNVFVHGSFQETMGSKMKRSFSRVFLLAPAPADSSKHEGWPLVIINDQLYIRHFTQKKAKAPPPQLPAQSAATDVQDLTARLSSITTPTQEEQQGLVARIREASKMNAQFSQECLAQNNWDFERALANFHALMVRPLFFSLPSFFPSFLFSSLFSSSPLFFFSLFLSFSPLFIFIFIFLFFFSFFFFFFSFSFFFFSFFSFFFFSFFSFFFFFSPLPPPNLYVAQAQKVIPPEAFVN
eukprot:Phypoly_transcript_05572.p1 GENE.Phypoly_transcript_05572~~Phypoly_transcript_05572.p1  ORF type:complete len:554 (+),score=93.79 Phypoly_transcript_05572:210-1871(+)